MTFFQTVDSIETRALALHRMIEMLTVLADTHEKSLHASISADRLWHKFNATDAGGKASHVSAALNAEFVQDVSRGTQGESKLRLTPKGWAAIGRKVPMWMEDAA